MYDSLVGEAPPAPEESSEASPSKVLVGLGLASEPAPEPSLLEKMGRAMEPEPAPEPSLLEKMGRAMEPEPAPEPSLLEKMGRAMEPEPEPTLLEKIDVRSVFTEPKPV